MATPHPPPRRQADGVQRKGSSQPLDSEIVPARVLPKPWRPPDPGPDGAGEGGRAPKGGGSAHALGCAGGKRGETHPRSNQENTGGYHTYTPTTVQIPTLASRNPRHFPESGKIIVQRVPVHRPRGPPEVHEVQRVPKPPENLGIGPLEKPQPPRPPPAALGRREEGGRVRGHRARPPRDDLTGHNLHPNEVLD